MNRYYFKLFYIIGADYSVAQGIALDVNGNAYITGYTRANYPTTKGVFQPTFNGPNTPSTYECFVTKLNFDTIIYIETISGFPRCIASNDSINFNLQQIIILIKGIFLKHNFLILQEVLVIL